MKRFTSMILALCMVLSLLPSRAVALWDEDLGAQVVDLPIKPIGDTDGADGATDPVQALIPKAEKKFYVYEGTDYFYLSGEIPLLDPETGEYLLQEPADNGVVQLLDAQGNVLATSYAESPNARYEYVNDVRTLQYYYVSYISFESNELYDLSTVSDGEYALRYVCGSNNEDTYPCESCVFVVDDSDLLIRSVWANLQTGVSALDVEVHLIGFRTEEELSHLSFQLLNGEGTVVANSSGRFKDVRVNHSGKITEWNLYAELNLDDGTLIQGEEYTLRVLYTGERDLYDCAGAVTDYPSIPNTQISNLEILDPQTGVVELSFLYGNAGYEYVVEVSTSLRGTESMVGYYRGNLPASGKLQMTLGVNGLPTPLSSMGYNFQFTLYQVEETYLNEISSVSYDNPYYNLSSGNGWMDFFPREFSTAATSLCFIIEGYNSSAYLGKDDTVTLVDMEGTVVATCSEVTELSYTGREFQLEGTFLFDTPLQEGEYWVCLNGIEITTVYAAEGLCVDFIIPMTGWNSDDTYCFGTILGVFPVTANVLNASGSAELLIQDLDGNTAVSSGFLPAGTPDKYGYTAYSYEFTAQQLSALTEGENYQVVFRDSLNSTQNREIGMYTTEKITDGFSDRLSPIRESIAIGGTTIPMRLSLGDGLLNLSEADLKELFAPILAVNTETEDTFSVLNVTGIGWLDDHDSYRFDMMMDSTLTEGYYDLYYGDNYFGWFSLRSPSTGTYPPYLSSVDDIKLGYIEGMYLPDGSYTAKVYSGYTCMTEEALALTRKHTGEDSYILQFDKNKLSHLEPGEYEIRVFLDGELLDTVMLTIRDLSRPIVTIHHDYESYNDSSSLLNYTGFYYFEVANGGVYTMLKTANSEEELADAKYYDASRRILYNVTEGSGEKTVYVRLMTADGKTETDVMTFTFWYMDEEELLPVYVHEDFEGIYNRDYITFTMGADNRYALAWLEVGTPEGSKTAFPMAYQGFSELPGLYIPDGSIVLESSHPYASGANETWTYPVEGATRLKVTFTEDTYFEGGYDFLYVYAGTPEDENQIGRYTGSELSGVTLEIPSGTVSFRLTSDHSMQEYGFAITSIVDPDAPPPEEGPEDTSNYKHIFSSGRLSITDSYYDHDTSEWFHLQDVTYLRFYLTDEYGNVVSEEIERTLIFGSLDSVILPQFRSDWEPTYINTSNFTLYGYATPGSAVTVEEDGMDPVIVTAGENGYFSVELKNLSEGEHQLHVHDSNSSTASVSVTLIVDTVAPTISSAEFSFSPNGTATLTWTYSDSDIVRFTLSKTSTDTGITTAIDNHIYASEYDGIISYTVAASENDGYVFTIRAYDLVGNVGERTISTADQVPPTAPEEVFVEFATTTTVTVGWIEGTDNKAVLGYDVYMDGQVVAKSVDALCYTFSGLEHGSTHTFSVRTRDEAGNLSGFSPELEAKTVTLTVTPVMEESYIVDLYPDGRIPVEYTVSADSEDFKFSLEEVWMKYRLSGTNGVWGRTTLYTNGQGIWSILGIEEDGFLPKGSYDIFFHAVDAEGVEIVSDPVTVVVLTVDEEPPTAPGIAAALSHTSGSITFTWDAAIDNVAVTGYSVYRDGKWLADTAERTYTDTGLEPGKEYTYTVTAVDGRGNISQPSEASVLSTLVLEFESVTDFEDSYVLEYLIFEEDGRTYREGDLHAWATVKQEEGYTSRFTVQLQYLAPGAEEWVSVNMQPAEDINHFELFLSGTDVEGSALGDYRIRFSVTDGESTAYSQEQTVTLTPETVPPEVEFISPIGGTYGGMAIDLDTAATDNIGVVCQEFWYAPEYSENYTMIIRISTTGGAWYVWDASELESGRYTVKAIAYDARGNAGEKTVTITIDNTPPEVPAGLTATVTSRYIHVLWSRDYVPTADFDSFRVYRSESADGPFTLVQDRHSVGYYDDGTTAEEGVTYFYYVTAVDIYGNESEPSEVVSATFMNDTESPVIHDMVPGDKEPLRKEYTLQVSASDNYRLSTAVFSYRLKGSGKWIDIGSVTAEKATYSQIFALNWTIPESIAKGEYEIRALVYDSSFTDIDPNSGYSYNEPAELIRTVTIWPYSLPTAPSVTAEAGYKTAALSWTYSGDTETLSHFIVYRTDSSGGKESYVTSVTPGKTGSCDAEIPAEGAQYFVVVAVDVYGETARSKVISVTSAPRETEPPVAVIQPENLAAATGVPFTFSAVNSTDNDVIESYQWDFGDGTKGSGTNYSHVYGEPGTYTVTLTVTDACGNTDTASAIMTVYDVTSPDAEHALITLSIVDAHLENTPAVDGAEVKVYTDTFETSAVSNAAGTVSLVVPVGTVTVAVTADGFIATSRSVSVEPDETGCFSYTVGMTPVNVSLVDGSLTVDEMTYDEILRAGIDVTDPDNNHVWKFAATLEFVAGPALKFDIPLEGWFSSSGKFLGGTGWGWGSFGTGGFASGGSGTGWGMNVGVFPISEHFLLVIYGEAHWLKEMYNVELIVINNSYVDDITDCEATLLLPDGLSFAAMTGREQTPYIEIGTIPHKTSASDTANTAKVNWYVRGDKEGEYNLTASVVGRNPKPFIKGFTTDKPVKVYAGSALKLKITAGDLAFRGEEYHVRFELINVSEKDLYNLSFGITGAEQFKVITMGDSVGELRLNHDDFGDSMTQKIDVLKPGGSIVIDFYTTTWFNSVLELVDMGPFDVGYYLTNVFVTTLEGSTTSVPYDVEIVHVSHGSFFEWLLGQGAEALDGHFIDLVDKYFFDEIPVVSTFKKVYEFASEDTSDTSSRAVISIHNGYFTPSNNFLRNTVAPTPAPEGAISVYTDGQYEISADGKTMTLIGPGKIYVEGESAGEATMTVTTYAEMSDGTVQECVYEMDYILRDGSVTVEDLYLQEPVGVDENGAVPVPLAGNTTDVTFPYLLVGSDGSYYTEAENAVWSVSGDDTAGLSVKNGILTVESHAKGGEYTVTLTVGDKSASQRITLTRDPSVLKGLRFYRDGAARAVTDILPAPASGSESYAISALGIDQYGVPFGVDVDWTVSTLPAGVTVENGVFTLTSDCSTGELILTASSGGHEISITVLIMGRGALTFAQETLDGTGATVSLTNSTETDLPVLAVLAAYDADNRQVSCTLAELILVGGDSVDLTLSWPTDSNVTCLRAFLLNGDTLTPLAEAWRNT